jgi:hypothetical protein
MVDNNGIKSGVNYKVAYFEIIFMIGGLVNGKFLAFFKFGENNGIEEIIVNGREKIKKIIVFLKSLSMCDIFINFNNFTLNKFH